MTKTIALVHSLSEEVAIRELTAGLTTLGLNVAHEDWTFEPTNSLVERMRRAGQRVAALVVLGNDEGCLWFQEAADVRFLRHLGQRGIRLVRLTLGTRGTPSGVGQPRQQELAMDSQALARLAEAVLPAEELAAELQRLRTRCGEILTAIRPAPFTQDWTTLQRDLDLLLRSAVEVRCQIEIRSLALQEAGGMQWMTGFAALTREPAAMMPGTWDWLTEVGRRLIHDTRTDLATLPLLVERARREGVQEVAGLETILTRLETVFGHLWTGPEPA